MIELRPRKELLDPNFDGYKLSLEPVPVYRLTLECGADHILPSDDQYSFLHLKIFSLHNHLYKDPWTDDGIYFIDKMWRVQKIISDTNTGRLESTKEMWQMPNHQSRRSGHYNTSLCFPSEELAVLSDGAGILYIVQTGARSTSTQSQWKVLFSDKVCEKETPFIVADSRCSLLECRKEVHCVLLRVEEAKRDDVERRSAGSFDTTLEWITFAEGEMGSWSLRCFRCLSGPGGVNYIAMEPGCQALCLASEYPFEFIKDSESPILKDAAHNNGGKVQEEKKEYMWQQSAEDITVTFRLPDDTQKSDITVDVKDLRLCVAYRDRMLLEGPLANRLESELSTWAVERGKLEVVLVKQETGLMWSELVVGDTKGEHVMDPALVEEVHRRLAHLCSSEEKERGCTPGFNSDQLEECDAPPNTMAVLSRFEPITHKASHQVNLGGLQWLFNAQLAAEKLPAICLRHDVDGCVWQPEKPGEGKDDWPFTHVGTFMAFGYVQASKQQRKFSTCPSDLTYVAVCEAVSHVYIYRQPRVLATEMRNRRTGRRVAHTAQQQLVNLDTNKEVLGVHASPRILYILTSDTILALHINP
ncbi:nudC domain-containing protein 1 isoform X2 [Anabrus simplex]|uniref:nudC domain-containing protein 1 isoform X2 n=1 Tax=Anabrus simplex TaxID=316456 RepID=UPI0035A3A4FB